MKILWGVGFSNELKSRKIDEVWDNPQVLKNMTNNILVILESKFTVGVRLLQWYRHSAWKVHWKGNFEI